MNPLRIRHLSLAAAALFLLAAALNAYGFRIATPAAASINLSEYALPDGSLPDLCINSGSGEGTDARVHCEFCRLAAAIHLPDGRADTFGQQLTFVAVAYEPTAERPRSGPIARSAHARAPPLAAIS